MTTAPREAARERFAIRIEPRWRPFLRFWGVRPENAYVELDDRRVDARFGWSRLTTELSNVEAYSITGPYRALAAIGTRRSVRNGDVSFCGTARGGVCLRFRHPVAWARVLHPPALTLTPEDIDGFVRTLEARGITGDDRREH